MKNRFFICWAVAGVVLLSAAAMADTGKSAYSFLKIGMGAKSQAMAGAFVGLADDLSSLYYNPAGLTAPVYDVKVRSADYYSEDSGPSVQQKKIMPNRFQATLIDYLLDFQTGYLGYARALDEKSALGLSLQYFDYGSFVRRDEFGEELGSFGAYDMAFGVTYSKLVAARTSIGITGRFIIEKIENYSSDALAVDFGAVNRLADGRTSLGVVVRNFGSQLKGQTKAHKDPLPTLVEAGFSHRLRGMPLTFDIDITVPTDNGVFFALGGQWESFRPFMLRVGWSYAGQDYKTGSGKDNFGGFAGGFGYVYKDYLLDYSFSSYADLGNVHRFTLGVEF